MNKLIALFILTLNHNGGGPNASRWKILRLSRRAEYRRREKEIEKKPAQYSAYNQLAIALSRRARETSDVAYYSQAEDALKKSQDLAPNNLEAAKIHVWLLLGRHEFPAALEAATLLNKRIPDDVLVYGFLTDANAELGNYEAAEKAAQWMLNLRPGNLPGMTRAAYLRELFGDVDGAYDLMNTAYRRHCANRD